MQFTTPITMMVFNRPELTERLFGIVASQRPKTLLVIADGPREGRVGEAEKCKAVRSIVSKVDWPCELLTNFSDVNLRCRARFTTGLNWVFEQFEQAIILEDDCVPDPTFFTFCEEILDRYRDDPRVMHITGNNWLPGDWNYPASYYFSHYTACWGWATWRRAWKLFDPMIPNWPQVKASGFLSSYLPNPREVAFWTRNFDQVHSSGADIWDYQWTFACMSNRGLGVTPMVNLVSNVGTGPDATHTNTGEPRMNWPTGSISFPLRHPLAIERCTAEDEQLFSQYLDPRGPDPGLMLRARRKVGRTLRKVGRTLRKVGILP
jgi:hypothetical protein